MRNRSVVKEKLLNLVIEEDSVLDVRELGECGKRKREERGKGSQLNS